MRIHREGTSILVVSLAVFLLLNSLSWYLISCDIFNILLTTFSVFVYLMMVNFFRSPKRVFPLDSVEKLVVAPADGKVVVIEEVYEPDHFKDNRRMISIFMSPMNVHANWYPVDGVVKRVGHQKGKFHKAWRVTNLKTQQRFDEFVKLNKIKDKRLLFHGSRNENWWSIINSGLVLKPTNAVITGKLYGYGIYFAPKARKSLGYTSLSGSYWAHGNSNSGFMALMDVAYGVPYDVYDFNSKYYDMNYDNLQRFKQGANCLHAHAGANLGGYSSLKNDEIIVYNGNYDYYKDHLQTEINEKKLNNETKNETNSKYTEDRKNKAQDRKRRAKLMNTEKEIEALQQKIDELKNLIEQPEISSDYERLSEILEEIRIKEETLDELEMQWLELA